MSSWVTLCGLVVVICVCAQICTVTAKSQTKCLDHNAEITLKDGTKIRGWKNVGRCTCQQAYQQEFMPQAADKWAPHCNGDKFNKLQQDYWMGSWCVDENGNQVSKRKGRDDKDRRPIQC